MSRKLIRKYNSNVIDVLLANDPTQMTIKDRIRLTTSCKDTEEIPKVNNAGQIVTENALKIQIMHNGVKILADSYYGELITPIIKALKGHHEPQEEKVFNYLLQRLRKNNPTMIELGSHWAYYSLWFKNSFPGGFNLCCEPDPHNLEMGKENAKLNNCNNITFLQALAGFRDQESTRFSLDSNPNESVMLPIRSVDSLSHEYGIKYLDLLHFDVQGAELETLHGASTMINSKQLRFVVISTHHYLFSRDPLTHQKCEKFILEHGGHIIASHTIQQSYSGDGLIVASFSERDKNFIVDISANTGSSMFRPYEEDLNILLQYYSRK